MRKSIELKEKCYGYELKVEYKEIMNKHVYRENVTEKCEKCEMAVEMVEDEVDVLEE